MNGALSLVIALVSYGNNFIVNGNSSPLLDFNNSTLIYNSSLTFYNSLAAGGQSIIATNPQEWFNYLKKDGCKRLKIYYAHSNQFSAKDYQTAGFVGGGGNWIIEAVYDKHADYWLYSMNVTNRNALDKRVWGTEFYVIKDKPPIVEENQSIEKKKDELSSVLSRIEKFANENALQYWGDWFNKANKTLTDPNPSVKYYSDFVVKDQLSLSAKQLLFAASNAYVFGGMGSWNDNGFSDKQKNELYLTLTGELYEQVNKSIIVAINFNK